MSINWGSINWGGSYQMSGSHGTLTVSQSTLNASNSPPDTYVTTERLLDLQTELVLAKEKLDVAVKVIADLFESKPTLELSEQAKMRAALAEIIDDLLDRAAVAERRREEEKHKKAAAAVTKSIYDKAEPWPTYASQDVRLTTDDLRRMINEEFNSRWHRDR